MYSRLQNELEKILVPYNISNETTIFNDVLMKLTGVPVNKTYRFGFHENNYYHEGSSKKDNELSFIIPRVGYEDVKKILAFLKCSEESYKVGDLLNIPEDFLLKTLVPIFETYVHSAMKINPLELRPYVLKSKSALEKKAIEKIKNASKNLIKLCESGQDIDDNSALLSGYLNHLLALIYKLDSNPDLYLPIMNYHKKFQTFFTNHPEFEQKTDYLTDMKLLDEGFINYAKFNRAESVLAVSAFFKELLEFTQSHNINSANCDVFEEFLMEMASIRNKPKSCIIKSGKDEGTDATRIIFTIVGMNTEDAEKFIQYFQSVGDETAKKYEKSFRLMQESAVSYCSVTPKRPKRMLEKHSFEVDGLTLYQLILPRFRDKINECVSKFPEQLRKYQNMCVLKNVIEQIDLLEEKLDEDTEISSQSEWIKQVKNKLSTTRTLMNNFDQNDQCQFVNEILKITSDFSSFSVDIVSKDKNLNQSFIDLLRVLNTCIKQFAVTTLVSDVKPNDKMDMEIDIDPELSSYGSVAKTPGTIFFQNDQNATTRSTDSVNKNIVSNDGISKRFN